ncbi:MAG TPA: TetR/AcrR family transcriptional regulator [Pilimelia sp.]|nr:TetR/AcrR family transcriptional regulator [Pilimelia sp.]
MPTSDSRRLTRIADAAIEVVAADGARGLTHRAVDAAAGLPTGSTSYYARTRLALLEVVLDRLVALDQEQSGAVDGRYRLDTVDAVAAAGAAFARWALGDGRTRMLARWHLALEACREPALRARYAAAAARLRAPVLALLADLGSPDPRRHAGMVLRWFDGLLFDALVGPGRDGPPTPDDVRDELRELLHRLLAAAPAHARGPDGRPAHHPAG